MRVTIYDNNLDVKINELSISQKHGIDLITDNSNSLALRSDLTKVEKKDLLRIKDNGKDFFYIINKVYASENQIQIKSVLDLFNDEFEIDDLETLTLKTLIERFYLNAVDVQQNIQMIDTSLLNNTINLVSPIEQNADNLTTKFNIKNLIQSTIKKNRFIFEILSDLNNDKIKIKIDFQDFPITKINLNNQIFKEVNVPKVELSYNSCDVRNITTTKKTINNNEGGTTEIEEVLTDTITRYVLLTDNTITDDLNNTNRVLPLKNTTRKVTHNELEPINELGLAEDVLIDTSKYQIDFSLYENRKTFLNNLILGQQVQVYYLDNVFNSLVTGYLKSDKKIQIILGLNRQDLLYEIKKIKEVF